VVRIARALVSVSDKRGLAEFASGLRALGIQILSTGGTLAALHDAGIPARAVSEVTGFPEILGGRVKTLHPKIHGAILAVDTKSDHIRDLQEHGIEPVQMVVANLYPFDQTVARVGVTMDEALEQIDIGGPAMIRAAAKNFPHRAVVVNPDRYGQVLEELRSSGGTLSQATRLALAREAFHHTAGYDSRIAAFLDKGDGGTALPATLSITARQARVLRYGENPHQRAALYGEFETVFEKLHGKELSFNNITDIAAASMLAAEFDEPTVVIVKHSNPCGVGSGATLAEGYRNAFATDTSSPFGGIVAVNTVLDAEAARLINEIFTEVIVAPGYLEDVLPFLQKKRDRRLILQHGDLRALRTRDLRSVPGGYLLQDADPVGGAGEEHRVVTRRQPTEQEERAMDFAWRVVSHVKSNAIVYARPDRTMAIGAGQMSRIDAARIASRKAAEAGLSLEATAVGSDAFFPFADALLETVRAGATAVIQPGGSIRDEEVIRAADQHNIAMVFTGVRHFRH
jgi:phosphoribosylaminoimidazolecarboxamide formyltransferase/IMP cyclohydrolase